MPALKLDRMARSILQHLSSHPDIDTVAVARALGITEEVARARIGAMVEAGILRGLDVDVPRGSTWCEYLVSGVATPATSADAIERLCSDAHVTRVFGLASSHSLAFTLGSDDPEGRQRALALAEEAGLADPTAILIVNTFQDRRAVPA